MAKNKSDEQDRKAKNALIEMLRAMGAEVITVQPNYLVIEHTDLLSLLEAVILNTAQQGAPRDVSRCALMLIDAYIQRHAIHKVEVVDEYSGDGFSRSFQLSDN